MNRRNASVKSARNFLWACILSLCAASVALGQAGRGSISGLVTDPGGAVVAGAKVVLLDRATGVTQHTATSSAGLYTFISLNPGVYQVTASQTGFKSVAQDKVTVTVDQVTEVNITLQVGIISETITVTQGVELVEPSNSTVGQLIESTTIDRVPLLYRNVYDLVQLSAGVIPVNGSPNSSDSTATSGAQNISSGRPGVDVSADTINGAIVGSVYYMLDGSPIGIAENNAAAIIPAMNIPEDGVEEVRVETQNTPASYQSGAAGVISLVSKSGTNKFHGDVFGVFRPNALSANDYFNKDYELQNGLSNAPPSFYRYQEGAAIGGPIKKDKLFFFADYEDTQQMQFEGIKTYTVPTSAERTGDFSALLNNTVDGAPAPVIIYDPTLPDIIVPCPPPNQMSGCPQRQPFGGLANPTNMIPNPNPIGLLYLSKMPKCNYPNPSTCDSATYDVSPNYSVPGLDPFHAHRFDIRVDWAKSERQRIFTRFSYDKLIFSTANVFPSGWDPDYAQNTTNGRNILLADDLTLNSSTVLNLRYSFTRHHEVQGNPAYSSTNITNLGFPSSLASQVVYNQLPFILFDDVGGGVGGTADYNNFAYASENSDANAAITKVYGKQTISFGFEWMKRYLNVGQPPAPAGAYGFNVDATDQSVASVNGGSDFASLLVGMGSEPGTETNGGNYPSFTKDVFAAESNPYYAVFFEDTYHLSKALTITAGLRWDIFGGRNERFNRQEYFNPNVSNTVDGVSYTGAEIYVNSGNRSPFTPNLHNLGPRLAFAWQPVTHLVLRGGAGFYYGPSTHNVGSALLNTDGFSSQTFWNATCFNADGNTVFNSDSGTCAAGQADNFTVPYSLSNPFPDGVVPTFTSPPPGLANNLGQTLSTVLRSQRTPTIYNFNFAVEYELPHQVVATVGYVGSRGLFLPFSNVDLNVLDLGTIAKYGYSLCVDPSQASCIYVPNQWAPIQPATNANSGAATVPLWVALQQFPQFGNGSYGGGNGVLVNGYPAGDSEYSSLQAKVQKRLTSHFTTLATFTWGKILTDDGNPPLGFVGTHLGAAQDWRNLNLEHSISPQDVKYQFTGEVSYDLPVGKGRGVNLSGVADAILGGWTTNAIAYLGTGVPIASPTSGVPISYFNQRADMTCNPAAGAPHTVAVWFTDNCFAVPGTEATGNPNNFNPLIPGTAPAYLDHVRTRGARDLDLSIYKTFSFGETKALRFDVSSYNISNTPQYGYPSVPSIVGATQQSLPFGQILNTVNTPRQFQFGARFTF
ncbi:MAG: carboxypeptidase-like regulatory domain-containing protein [Candidatus Sulfotelmatobacter sp.]